MLPLPPPDPSWAIFLDVDGTLAEIVEHPDDVVVDDALKATLECLHARLDGALAIVSGRPIAQIDALFAPLVLPAAGLHGLERREPGSEKIRSTPPPAWVAPVCARLEAFAEDHPGVWIEDKIVSAALHFRGAPAAERAALELARGVADTAPDGMMIQHGKMVIEFRPDSGDKDMAITGFLSAPPFAGRRPVFIGDDVTDEDGFRTVKHRNGIAVRIGDGETAADWRIDTVADAHRWLAEIARTLEAHDVKGAS